MRRCAAALLPLLLLAAPAPAAGEGGDAVAAVDRAISGWERSCGGPTELGACTRTRVVAVDNRCEMSGRTVEVRRSPKSARAAQVALAVALAALEKRADAALPAQAAAAARGRSSLAEAAYEDFLRLRFPTGLDFSGARKKDSEKRFNAFFVEARKRLDSATEAYRHVADHPGVTAELRLRAAARTGQLHARFAELLLGAEIPRDVRTGDLAADKIAAFCDVMEDEITPIEERARVAFEECRALAAGQGPWAAVCDWP